MYVPNNSIYESISDIDRINDQQHQASKCQEVHGDQDVFRFVVFAHDFARPNTQYDTGNNKTALILEKINI